jgi:hypothetical protein
MKSKRRSDMGVVLEDMFDDNKTFLQVGFKYMEDGL